MMLLVQFIALQLLDALTTLRFLRQGVAEANPLIGAILGSAAQPALALALPKLFAVLLGVYAWRSGRWSFLRRINLFFAACVIWNLVAGTI